MLQKYMKPIRVWSQESFTATFGDSQSKQADTKPTFIWLETQTQVNYRHTSNGNKKGILKSKMQKSIIRKPDLNSTYKFNNQVAVQKFTISLRVSIRIRSTQASTADLQPETSFWSAESGTDSERSSWVLTMAKMEESSEGFRNGRVSSGTCSLSKERSKRGFNPTS